MNRPLPVRRITREEIEQARRLSDLRTRALAGDVIAAVQLLTTFGEELLPEGTPPSPLEPRS